MQDVKSSFETSNLGLAAYLISSGVKLEHIDRTNQRRYIFVFGHCDPALIANWQSGKAETNGLAFYTNLQNLKGQLYRGEC